MITITVQICRWGRLGLDLRNLLVVLQRVVAQTISRFDHLAAMGNHACCGHNAVAEPEAVAPVPENAEKPQEETVETLELAAKDVIIETTSKEVEEIPSPPTSPSSADMRKAFGGKVVSSCSLQGIHVDEDAEAKKQITAQRLRADTQQSVMSMMLVMMVMSCMSEVVSCFEILFGHLVLTQISWLVSPRIYGHPSGKPRTSTKSIVEVISDFFRGSSRPDFNGEWVCIATWGCSECKLRARIDTVSWHHAAPLLYPVLVQARHFHICIGTGPDKDDNV